MDHLLQGDTGQAWTKIAIGQIRKEDLEMVLGVHLQAAGVQFLEECKEPIKKRRRTHEEGVGGGRQFTD